MLQSRLNRMAQSVHRSLLLPSIAPRTVLAAHVEAALLAIVVAFALVARVVGLDSIEPNIASDEADHLRALYQILAGRGPGLLDVSPEGSPAAALYPAAFFLELFGPSYVALRLSTALASLLTLIVLFVLARPSLSFFASFGATVLLAFAGWYLYFSRNGELNVWAVLFGLAAAYFTQQALDTGRWRDWRFGGLFCGLGWYSDLSGVLILPTMLLYLVVAALLDRPRWRRAVLGSGTLTLITLALLLPRLPILLEKRSAVEAAVTAGSVLQGARAADLPGLLANQLWGSLRALVLMDPSLTGDPRYLAPGRPVLDSLTAALYFAGLFLGLGRFRQTALWWCLFVPIILTSSLARTIPDGARALPALPAMLLFAGLTIDWLIGRKNLGDLAGLGLTLAIPLAAYWNWSHYVEWQRQPSNAAARQPAVEVAEFPIWQELQLAEALAGGPGFGPSDWQDLREQYRPALAASAAASTAGRVASKVEAHPLAGFGAVDGLKKPRGVAVDASGTIFVLDADGRILKLDQTGKTIATLGVASGGPPTEEVADLALAPDGSLLVLDAGPGRIDRYDPGGGFAASLGAGWGMYRPRGLTVGPDGRIYVADTGRNRVVVASGGAVEKELTDLEQPTDVAVDGQGRVYVVQPEASKLSVLDSDGKPQASWAISRGNTVDGPHLALLEAGALAITDRAKHRVVFSDPSGREVGQIGGENDPAFGLPYAVAAAGQRLLVADSGKSGLQAYEVVAR